MHFWLSSERKLRGEKKERKTKKFQAIARGMNTELWNRFHGFLDLLRSPETRDLLPSGVVHCVINDPDTVKVQVKLVSIVM